LIPDINGLIATVPERGTILDVGCRGWRYHHLARALNRPDILNAGVDYSENGELPDGVDFRRADLNAGALPFEADVFDFVAAAHIIEHVRDPIAFFAELVRVTKPGGRIYLEAPSERSLLPFGMPFAFEECRSLSFYDDPTHLGRPWPPQALYRLAECFSCTTLSAGYITSFGGRLRAPILILLGLVLRRGRWLEDGIWKLVGWASFAIVEKPATLSGAPTFHYAGGKGR